MLLGCIIVALAMAGCCFGFTRFNKMPIETTPLFTVAATVTLLYVCAYLGFLQVATYLMLAFGLGLLLFSPFYIRNREQLFAQYLTPAFCIWIILTAIFCYFAVHRGLYQWDDFDEWAPHAKAIFFKNGFPGVVHYGMNNDYPPGLGLYYYPFLLMMGLSDSAMKLAHCSLIMSPLLVLFCRSQWSQWQRTAALLVLTTLGLLFLYHTHLGFNMLLGPDDAIGLTLGAMLSYYY